MGFSRQEHRSGQNFLLQGIFLFFFSGDLSDPGIELDSPALAGGLFTTSATWEALVV